MHGSTWHTIHMHGAIRSTVCMHGAISHTVYMHGSMWCTGYMHGSMWSTVYIHGSMWHTYMVLCDAQYTCMVLCDVQYTYMVLCDIQYTCMVLCDIQYTCMVLYGLVYLLALVIVSAPLLWVSVTLGGPPQGSWSPIPSLPPPGYDVSLPSSSPGYDVQYTCMALCDLVYLLAPGTVSSPIPSGSVTLCGPPQGSWSLALQVQSEALLACRPEKEVYCA